MCPTLTGPAGAPLGKNKPLDGLDVWATIAEGKPLPRTELALDIEPFRAAIRNGDWGRLLQFRPVPLYQREGQAAQSVRTGTGRSLPR